MRHNPPVAPASAPARARVSLDHKRMTTQSVATEVERCLSSFVRLCVNRVIQTGEALDKSAIMVASALHAKLPPATSAALRAHFEASLAQLVELVSALAARLPPQVLRDFAERASEVQIAATLERSLRSAIRTET